jgi:hypothetical protein
MFPLHELLQRTRALLWQKLTDVDITAIVVLDGSHVYHYIVAVGALDEGIKTAILKITLSEITYKLQDVERSSASVAFDLFNIIEAGGNDTERINVGRSLALSDTLNKVLM